MIAGPLPRCCALRRQLQAAGVMEAKQIETILVNTLEIARSQRARCWELRTACDLARFWQGQGEP